MDRAKKLDIFQRRLSGSSVQQLSLDFGLDSKSIESVVAEVVQAIREDCKLTLQQRKQIELERIDRWSDIAEQCLKRDCDDAIDPETGKVYRDGVKAKAIMLKHLLDLSKHRATILKLTDLEEDVKSEAALLFDKIKDVDLDSISDIDELLSYNKKLQSL